MTDLTPLFNQALAKRHAPAVANCPLSTEHLDEFLKEAYRINSHIASLNAYLRSIRQSYLSTAPPPRRVHHSHTHSQHQTQYLTDRQRDEIDAETKQLLRELNASIRSLRDAEALRQSTATSLLQKRYHTRLGGLGSWAAGGLVGGKSSEQEDEENRLKVLGGHRENVLWYLDRKLADVVGLQSGMMETRLGREMEKNKSLLYKAQGKMKASRAGMPEVPAFKGAEGARQEEYGHRNVEDELSPEQLQMFEKENQDMVRHYEETLNQVKTAEKSLVEISELQTQLVTNLATQSAHIDQLVADSNLTAENVGGGNKELKKASERKSTAKWVFYASCGVSLFLITWDLII